MSLVSREEKAGHQGAATDISGGAHYYMHYHEQQEDLTAGIKSYMTGTCYSVENIQCVLRICRWVQMYVPGLAPCLVLHVCYHRNVLHQPLAWPPPPQSPQVIFILPG